MSTIVIADQVCIPDWVKDLDSFRRWARSEDYPESGWFSYLDGQLWVDLSMEQLFSHNQVKTEFAAVLAKLVKSAGLGYYFSDRTLWSNVDAGLCTEPDGLFVSFGGLQSGRIKLVEGSQEGYVELEGTPDMVLEVISRTTVRKDTVVLRDLYWKAGVPEYWLVDARGDSPRFAILRRADDAYAESQASDGWLHSVAFDRDFQLTQQPDQLSHPQYTLAVRPQETP